MSVTGFSHCSTTDRHRQPISTPRLALRSTPTRRAMQPNYQRCLITRSPHSQRANLLNQALSTQRNSPGEMSSSLATMTVTYTQCSTRARIEERRLNTAHLVPHVSFHAASMDGHTTSTDPFARSPTRLYFPLPPAQQGSINSHAKNVMESSG